MDQVDRGGGQRASVGVPVSGGDSCLAVTPLPEGKSPSLRQRPHKEIHGYTNTEDEYLQLKTYPEVLLGFEVAKADELVH